MPIVSFPPAARHRVDLITLNNAAIAHDQTQARCCPVFRQQQRTSQRRDGGRKLEKNIPNLCEADRRQVLRLLVPAAPAVTFADTSSFAQLSLSIASTSETGNIEIGPRADSRGSVDTPPAAATSLLPRGSRIETPISRSRHFFSYLSRHSATPRQLGRDPRRLQRVRRAGGRRYPAAGPWRTVCGCNRPRPASRRTPYGGSPHWR